MCIIIITYGIYTANIALSLPWKYKQNMPCNLCDNEQNSSAILHIEGPAEQWPEEHITLNEDGIHTDTSMSTCPSYLNEWSSSYEWSIQSLLQAQTVVIQWLLKTWWKLWKALNISPKFTPQLRYC